MRWIFRVLVLLCVVGVAFAVMPIRFGGRAEVAKRSATARDLAEFRDAVVAFRDAHGRLPTAAEALPVATPGSGWHRMDAWGHPYAYKVTTGRTFEVRSAGPDGVIGTADDVVAP